MKTSVIEVRDMLSILTVDEVEKRIRHVPGVASATVNYAARSATVRYDETRLEVADIKAIIEPAQNQAVAPPPGAPTLDDRTGDSASYAPPPPYRSATAKAGSLDDPSVRSADEVASALGADLENGLTTQEALRRLSENGPNELRSAPRRPPWRRFLSHFHDPLVYLLLAAVAIALVAWVVEGLVGWPVDALVIAIIVLLNAGLGYVQEAKAEDAVAALGRMTAATSAVLRNGEMLRLPSAELVRGDLLVLGEGDAVGADARLVQTTSLRRAGSLADRRERSRAQGCRHAARTGGVHVRADCGARIFGRSR